MNLIYDLSEEVSLYKENAHLVLNLKDFIRWTRRFQRQNSKYLKANNMNKKVIFSKQFGNWCCCTTWQYGFCKYVKMNRSRCCGHRCVGSGERRRRRSWFLDGWKLVLLCWVKDQLHILKRSSWEEEEEHGHHQHQQSRICLLVHQVGLKGGDTLLMFSFIRLLWKICLNLTTFRVVGGNLCLHFYFLTIDMSKLLKSFML